MPQDNKTITVPLLQEPYHKWTLQSYNPILSNDITTLRKMIISDATIVYGYDFVRRGVAQRIGEYTHENPKIEQYVRDLVEPAYKQAMKSSLSAIYWGLSVAELIKEPVGKQIGLRKLYVTTPDLWWSSESIVEDEFYDIIAVRPSMGEEVPLFDKNGIQQIALYTYRKEYSNTFGFPTCKQIYPYWFIKSRALKFWAMYCERYGSPQALFKTDQNDQQAIQNGWANLGTNAVMVVNKDTEMDLIESSHQAGDEFLQIIEEMNKYILLSFYIPKLAVDEGKYSTRAQAETHLDVYMKTETEICNDFIEDYLIKQIIKPMIILNFGQQEDYGNISLNDPMEPSIKEWLDIFKGMKDTGLLNINQPEMVQMIEDKLGIVLGDLNTISMAPPSPEVPVV